MEHTVRKNRKNRIAMRIVAAIFIIVPLLQILAIAVTGNGGRAWILFVCAFCIGYGVNLLRQTLKPQAYDITYVFGDKTLTLKMHRKERIISYGEITDLGYVIPNPNLDYSMIQLYIGKEQFVLPFASNTNVAKALYEMLQMKKEEAMADRSGEQNAE